MDQFFVAAGHLFILAVRAANRWNFKQSADATTWQATVAVHERWPKIPSELATIEPSSTFIPPTQSSSMTRDRGSGQKESDRPISPPRRQGDTIAAQIGDDAQNVVVGKNVIQIGTLSIPYWVVALIVVILLLILGFVAYEPIRALMMPPPPPEPMTGKFNIAVARFGEMDDNGQIEPSKQGAQLSQWVTERLIDEFEANKELFGSGNVIDLRLIDQNYSTGRIDEGVLTGSTVLARQQDAIQLADQIDADMVIYGNLVDQASDDPNAIDMAVDVKDGNFLALEFYLDPAFGEEPQQVVGHYSMGKAVPVANSLEGLDKFSASQALETRAHALAGLTIGLIFDLLGDHEKALEILSDLEQDLADWRDDQGKELLYYMTGRQQLFLGHYDEAEASARRALGAREDYSRAHVVLGSTYASRSNDEMLKTQQPEIENAAKALASYEAAVASAQQEGNTLVEQTARTALGLGHLLVAQGAYLEKEYDDAIDALTRSLDELSVVYEPLEASGQFRYLAQAHQYQGNAHFLYAAVNLAQEDDASRRANLEAAGNAYSRCIEQGARSSADQTLQETVIAERCQPMYDTTVKEIAKLEGTP